MAAGKTEIKVKWKTRPCIITLPNKWLIISRGYSTLGKHDFPSISFPW